MPPLNPLTLNVAMNYVDNARAIAEIKPLNPSALVLCTDRQNDGARFDVFAREFPDAMIVCRVVPANRSNEDAEYHLPGPDGGYRMSPTTFLNTFGGLGTNGKLLYTMNEPDGYNNVDRLVSWLVEVTQEATRRNIRLCLGNLATGHPRDVSSRQWDRVWDPLLLLLSAPQHRALHVLGLHEYHPGWEFRVGRFRWMLESCRRLFVMPPRVLVTEFGIDSDHGGSQHNGWRSRGMSEQQYFDLCLDSYNRMYRTFVRGGVIAGIAVFLYGNSGGWEAFDVSNAATYMQLLRTIPQENVQAALPDSVPLPTGAYVVGSARSSVAATNIRTGPSVNHRVVTQLTQATVANASTLPGYNASGPWVPLRLNGLEGWIHRDFMRFTPAVQPPVPPLPTPVERSVTLRADRTADIDAFLAQAGNFKVTVKP